MKPIYFFLAVVFLHFNVNAQKEYHVFPENHPKTPGSPIGIGSISNPWDLETALNQSNKVVNGGDMIWLHEGIYTGQFISTLNSTIPNKFITVASFKEEKVVLDGNVNADRGNVLQVKGGRVIFKDFEVTCLGKFSRNQLEPNFKRINGVDHPSGEDCRFINLEIHDLPGLGFGSWKNTGGSVIDKCMIYNNGYIAINGKGTGEGMYVQNNSGKERFITNNTIFNNYYKGIEVWSANKRADQEYVKNVTLRNNVIFNNGTPSGGFKDNLIVATDDRNGINIAKNISVLSNVFYHNTNVAQNQVNGDGASLTLGFHAAAPIENVKIHDNIIVGRNNALRILHAKKLSYRNNISYAGYVHFMKSVVPYINTNDWNFDNNTYYTKNNRTFRISKFKDYVFSDWKSTFKIDKNSSTAHIREFDLKNVLNITPTSFNAYRVVLFDKNGNDVKVNFSKFNISEGTSYKIYDVENLDVVLKSGEIQKGQIISFPMNTKDFQRPLHNEKAQKTLNNFGVYFIEFEEKREKKSFLKRLIEKLF